MLIEKSEKQQGQGESTPNIGYFLGNLIAVNPTAKENAAIYGYELKEDATDTEYVKDDYTMLKLLFKTEKGEIVPWNLFLKNKKATWENDGKTMTVHVNQHGKSFVQTDDQDLPDWFTELAIWDRDEKKFVKVKKNGKQVMLNTHVAIEGEAELLGYLRTAVKVDWFTATEKTDLFSAPIKDLLKGKVGSIKELIKNEDLNPVVGMTEVAVKTVENEIKYYPNCISKCWMEEKELKACNLYSSQGKWDYLGSEEAKNNKKLYNIRSFYYWAKKSKNCVEFNALHPFDPTAHQNAGNATIVHSDTHEEEIDSEI